MLPKPLSENVLVGRRSVSTKDALADRLSHDRIMADSRSAWTFMSFYTSQIEPDIRQLQSAQ
jgi:hypothetical protein